jgi:hypothetical protein
MIKNKDRQSKNTLDKLLKEANKVNVKELMTNSLFTNKDKKETTKSKKIVSKKNKKTKKHK